MAGIEISNLPPASSVGAADQFPIVQAGVTKRAGIGNILDAQMGWEFIDSFEDGATITKRNQALRLEATGALYRWDGALPKVVPAASTPGSTGGVLVGAWIEVFNPELPGTNDLIYDIVATVDLPRLSGQITQNSEAILSADNDLLVLCKGSYSLDDSSFLTRFRLGNGEITQVGDPLDLGTGADCRAITRNKDYAYVFRGTAIDIVDCRGDNLAIVGTITRGDGFVQTCMMTSNGYLVAPVWGNNAIEIYEVNYPQIRLVSTYTTPTTENASVVENGGKCWLINHGATVNQIASFFIDGDGAIQDFQSFTIAEMVNCRYAAFAEGRLYTGSYSTGSGVEIDISGETPAFSRTMPNIPNPVLFGRYIYGTIYAAGVAGGMKRYSIDTGTVEDVHANGLLYPLVTPNYMLGIVEGDEAPAPGSTPNDSPMGQALRIVRMREGTAFVGNKPLRVQPQPIPKPFYSKSLDNYVTGVTTAGVPLMRVTLDSAAPFANFRLLVKAWILDNQSAPTTTRDCYMEGYVNGFYSGSQWTFNNTDFVMTTRTGISDVAIKIGATSTTNKRLDVIAVSGVDLPNAQVVVEVTFESLAAYFAELTRDGLTLDTYTDSRTSSKGNTFGAATKTTGGGGVLECGITFRPNDSGTYTLPNIVGAPDGIGLAVEVPRGLLPVINVDASGSPKIIGPTGVEDTTLTVDQYYRFHLIYNAVTNRWEIK